MNNRERSMAILNYQDYDGMPLIHFAYWTEVLLKWKMEGHITDADISDYSSYPNYVSKIIDRKLGFDYCWWFATYNRHLGLSLLYPLFEPEVLEITASGLKKVINPEGMIQYVKDGVGCIPSNAGSLLKGRKEWEELFLPKLKSMPERLDMDELEAMKKNEWSICPKGLYCGSLYGSVRNWLGVEGVSYLYADDEELFREIIDTIGDLCYKMTEMVLSTGIRFDFGHFWEDICFKNGSLINPIILREIMGPHYTRITGLLKKYGIEIISLDCDGKIDELLPVWLDCGINTMYPIEVGTWNADIKPWREKYGREIRGVGGMDKRVLAVDYAAVDKEIERLKPLVELGGFLPGIDHMITPDAIWENVQYYCDRMKRVFG
ncbi:MAG: uroporphyrinogen decarboxylase family protein [Saccharofermentanales bacterium]